MFMCSSSAMFPCFAIELLYISSGRGPFEEPQMSAIDTVGRVGPWRPGHTLRSPPLAAKGSP